MLVFNELIFWSNGVSVFKILTLLHHSITPGDQFNDISPDKYKKSFSYQNQSSLIRFLYTFDINLFEVDASNALSMLLWVDIMWFFMAAFAFSRSLSLRLSSTCLC